MANNVAYAQLPITNDFMFMKVMLNPEVCRKFLEVVLKKKITKIEYPLGQKVIDLAADAKGIRLDVYVEDEDTVYDIEMQTTSNTGLPNRTRYYQGLIDLNILSKGEDYKSLKKQVIIFVCTFDFFGKDLCRYTFHNSCDEDPELVLNDGTEKLFINIYGTKGDDGPGFRQLLDYLAESKLDADNETDLTSAMDRELNAARCNEEWRREYMRYEADKMDLLAKGRDEGENMLATLIGKMLTSSDRDSISLVVSDKKIRHDYYKKYGLV